MSAPRLVDLYLDHPKVGCGWRRYLVVAEGRKWATLLLTETCEPLRLPLVALAAGKVVPLKTGPMRKRLRRIAAEYGMQDDQRVKDALRILNGARP